MMTLFKQHTFEIYTVEKAVHSDGAAVFQILRDAASWLQKKGISQWEHLHNEVEVNEIIEDIQAGITYKVMDKSGKIVAVFNLSHEQNQWDIAMWGEREDRACYIHRLAVHENHHNKQIGQGILEWIDKNIQLDNGYVRLDCIANNPALNEFYQKAGYRFAGHIGEGEDKFSIYEKAF